MAYTEAERAQARELFCVDGLTLARAAEITGVAVSTVKQWSAEEDWPSRRAEYHQTLRNIETQKLELQEKLLRKALETLDPQMVYAATRLGSAITKSKAGEKTGPELDRPRCFLEDLEFVVEVLKETDPEGLKVFARNFDALVERGKARFAEGA